MKNWRVRALAAHQAHAGDELAIASCCYASLTRRFRIPQSAANHFFLAEDVGGRRHHYGNYRFVYNTTTRRGELIAKAPLVFGRNRFCSAKFFACLDSATEVKICSRDGEELKTPEQIPARGKKPPRHALLTGERVAIESPANA